MGNFVFFKSRFQNFGKFENDRLEKFQNDNFEKLSFLKKKLILKQRLLFS